MRPGECCEGEINPWRTDAICPTCFDARLVTPTDSCRRTELVPCPSCGDQTRRDTLVRERMKTLHPLPGITETDLSDTEKEDVKGWRARGFHMNDCLRWIESRRYDPLRDPQFLAQSKKALAKWRFLGSRPEISPTRHLGTASLRAEPAPPATTTPEKAVDPEFPPDRASEGNVVEKPVLDGPPE